MVDVNEANSSQEQPFHSALVSPSLTSPQSQKMTQPDRDAVIRAGKDFADKAAEKVEGIWMLISGQFTSADSDRGEKGTEGEIKEILTNVLGYQKAERLDQPKREQSKRTINVLLDSPGGSLDSAYTTALYLSAYATELNVYVPNKAKSASTLLAIGADKLFMSTFSELGPLDTQIPDPRNPTTNLSALDCYQSVDYVRMFGIRTIEQILPKLVSWTERRILINDLLSIAAEFSLGAVKPMLQRVTALDFGGWGRSLRIGEHYARKLLDYKALEAQSLDDYSETAAKAMAKDLHPAQIEKITHQLVYGYTHHLFPIDYHEAVQMGLNVEQMDEAIYCESLNVLNACQSKDFVGFISADEAKKEAETARQDHGTGSGAPLNEEGEHPQAHAMTTQGFPVEEPEDLSTTGEEMGTTDLG